MTSFAAAILAIALRLPAWHGDHETETERHDRYAVIAQSIATATAMATCTKTDVYTPPEKCKRIWSGTRRSLAMHLLTQAFFETRLARHVHAGECNKHWSSPKGGKECDSGRANSLWQLHAGRQLPVERWRATVGVGLEPTTNAAFAAAESLSRAYGYCKTPLGMYANYATGRSCTWAPASERLTFSENLASKL